MEERELSVVFSVAPSMYTSLFLTLTSSPLLDYTERRILIKNVYNNGGDEKKCIRTVQDEFGFYTQKKTCLKDNTYMGLYKHPESKLTLFLSISEKLSTEEIINLNDEEFKDIKEYYQVVRDYIYCRKNGMRIAIERKYSDYIDPDYKQMDYDCFNRYKFECCIHIEYEFEKNVDINNLLRIFPLMLSSDEIIHKLFFIMSNKNINCVSDEIVNIKNMSLTHKYSYTNTHGIYSKKIKYFSLKYDGVRKNFCIFDKYIQIGLDVYTLESHWFGQVIIGHCEIIENDIIIIDIYLISENFQKIAKKYNISYTGALQNYHHFYNNNKKNIETGLQQKGGNSLKTQDEYFHMKRLSNNVIFMGPIDAIHIIHLLKYIFKNEKKLSHYIKLQKFHKSINKLYSEGLKCNKKIDGFLGFNEDTIFKFKESQTVDMLFKFDEMFRHILKKMKPNGQDLKKMFKFIKFQKSLNWKDFEFKYPNKFNKFLPEFLYFSNYEPFHKKYPDWNVNINIDMFETELKSLSSTAFILLLEFEVDFIKKHLEFIRLRTDKFSANSINVFKKILKSSSIK